MITYPANRPDALGVGCPHQKKSAGPALSHPINRIKEVDLSPCSPTFELSRFGRITLRVGKADVEGIANHGFR